MTQKNVDEIINAVEMVPNLIPQIKLDAGNPLDQVTDSPNLSI
ncbi:1887_t:CDS:2 [Gigaspora rosea]|nr:1887_t:CDS:2 [Gigaspora rosea]